MGFFSACSWLALVTGVGGCALAEVEIGVLSCIFLYFWGVRVVRGFVLVYAHSRQIMQISFLLLRPRDVRV